jgi:23S rRNA pseudouridine1911/1915/1917 synthase
MKVTIDSTDQGSRVDKFVELKLKDLGFSQATRSMIKDEVSKGCKVNGIKVKPSNKLNIGDTVEIDEEFWKDFFGNKDLSEEIIPQEGDLDIIYEDEHILVIIKPKGLVVHPGVGNRTNTLANYIKHYLLSKNELDINMDRAGIVHRLDKGVSGIMVIAKNKNVQDILKEQFVKREVEKIYLATVEKFKASELDSITPKPVEEVLSEIERGDINYENWFEAKGFIGRDHINRYKMEFKLYEFGGSKPAKSFILPVDDSRLLIKIVTGRMHQIRATLNYYGYYIKGDTLYKPGKGNSSSEEIMLKSIYLSFTHPVTKEKLSFINP